MEEGQALGMRIGYYYALEAYPPRGGNHRHVVELVQGFLKAGHEVLVVNDPTMPGVTNFASTPSELKRFTDGLDVLYVRIDGRFIRDWPQLSACQDLVDRRKPVVWEINSPASECLAFSWLGGEYSEQEGTIRRLRRWVHAMRQQPGILLEERHRRHRARRVSSAICVSKAMGRYALEELRIEDVHVLPNGGPLIAEKEITDRRERRKHGGFTVFYSGSAIYPWQGIHYLAEVIALAEQRAPGMTFVLAVNQKTANLPTSDNVIILESLNQDEVRDAICAADVCVSLPPDWTWTKYGFHGSPTKLFEYMACMTAVVTSNIGQMKDILNHKTDAVLSETDPEEILAHLIYLRDNPEEREAIAREGWLRVQTELNWGRNVTDTLRIFSQV